MTNEKINNTLAEFFQAEIDDGKVYIVIDGNICGFGLFTDDLNAMHEAEVVIIKSGYTAIRTYEDLLQKQIANIIFATAAQRAEAFLKTLNLWIE